MVRIRIDHSASVSGLEEGRKGSKEPDWYEKMCGEEKSKRCSRREGK